MRNFFKQCSIYIRCWRQNLAEFYTASIFCLLSNSLDSLEKATIAHAMSNNVYTLCLSILS